MSPRIKSRIEKLIGGLGEKDIDGIFISQPENRRYLSGFDGSAGFLIITKSKSILATDSRYIIQAKSQALEYEILPVTSDIGGWFPGLAAGLNIKRLGFEGEYLTFSLYRRLCDILGKGKTGLELVPIEDIVEPLRAVKEPGEIELISQAAEISDAAMAYIREELHPGITEREAAWEIEKFMREKGSQPVPFDVIVASGPNAALPHAQPSARAIQEAEPIVIDIGARVGGYASDLSRTFCLGTPDETFKKVYDTVLGAQLGAMAIVKPGISGGEADQIARIIIEEGGYGEAFGHGLGHGVGLATHEKPRLGPNSPEELGDGMVFTIEPGIYIEGWGGVRIEDLVIMEKGKVREISKAKK
jgi:Xaa-Pro aminopeptidase